MIKSRTVDYQTAIKQGAYSNLLKINISTMPKYL